MKKIGNSGLEELSGAELDGLDAVLNWRARHLGASAFSEARLSGMPSGYPGLLVARQMQRNRLAQTGGELQTREDEVEALLSDPDTPPKEWAVALEEQAQIVSQRELETGRGE